MRRVSTFSSKICRLEFTPPKAATPTAPLFSQNHSPQKRPLLHTLPRGHYQCSIEPPCSLIARLPEKSAYHTLPFERRRSKMGQKQNTIVIGK